MSTHRALTHVITGLSVWGLLIMGICTSPARAQQENPVYVDDSPQAWEMFRRASDLVRENTAESVRMFQELLDDFALKLIPASQGDQDHFTSVRRRVHAALRADDNLLQRYRQIQTPAAQQMLDAGELERLARTRSLTEPGLEALLRLAQANLESARFHSALALLEQAAEHPDLAGKRAAHCQFMIGLASHDLGDAARVQHSLDALAALGAEGEQFRTQLEHLVGANDHPTLVDGASSLDSGHATDLNDLVAQAIWTQPLDDSLMRRRFNAAGAAGSIDDEQFRANFQQRVQEADLATTVATATPTNVFVNQGNSILSLNRLTGRKAWSFTDQSRLEIVDREAEPPLDLNLIAVSGAPGSEALVTLTGHANAGSRSSQGKVVCLDASTGSPRWTNDLRSLSGAEDEDLFPHGAPIISDGLVFVEARRVSQQLLTSAYVIALDLNDGRVRWSQYITSSGGLRQSPRPFCTLVWNDGSLYTSSPVGAIARLDPANGEIMWLRRYNVPLAQPIMDQARRPWELTAPVITPRGVLAIQPDQRRVVLLDRETGEQVESFSATSTDSWNTPRYLLADDHHVFAIGTEVRAFDPEALDHPIWRLPAPVVQQTAPAEPPATMEPLELRGRVQLVDGALIAPTAQGVLVVDKDTGQVRHRLAVETIGNPLAVDAQLVLACADRVDSYMSFARAEHMLRDRIVQAPAEPEPALSLLRLGMKVRRLPLALEAANLAMQSINRMNPTAPATPGARKPADARDELFGLLLDLAGAKIAETPEEGESLYAVIGAVALEPEQRVEYLLNYGDWLAGHNVEKSVETYQAILSDRILASALRTETNLRRPAASWTTDHLRALISQRGATVYAPQADFARTRLTQMLAKSEVDPTELVNLADEFPFADASADAAIAASKIHVQRHQPREALAAMTPSLSVALSTPTSSATAGKLLSAYVQVAQDAGWRRQAAAALRLAARRGGDLPLTADGATRNAKDWLARLGAAPSALPRIGDVQGDGKVITGSIIPMYDDRDDWTSLPPDRVLVREGPKLKLLTAGQLEPAWTSTIETDLPEILNVDDRAILLWMGADPEDPKALLIDATDGSLKWTTPKLNTLLAGDAVRDLGRIRGVQTQMPDGEPFDPLQTLPLFRGKTLVLLQRTGTVVCFDVPEQDAAKTQPAVDKGAATAVRWSRAQTLDQIHLAQLTDSALVLVGRTRRAEGDDRPGSGSGEVYQPGILVLDPRTGEPLFKDTPVFRPIGRGGVKWITIGPLGQMVYATAEGLEAVDLLSGDVIWTNNSYAALDAQHGWARDDRLVIEDRRSRLRDVNLAGGSISDQFDIPTRADLDPMDLRTVSLTDDRAIVHYRQRIVMYDDKGQVAGADVITDDRDYRWLLQASDRLLAISGRTEQAQIPDQNLRRMQHMYRIYSLSFNGKTLAEPLALTPKPERVQQAMLVNGWLLMSTQSDTLAMPMPAK